MSANLPCPPGLAVRRLRPSQKNPFGRREGRRFHLGESTCRPPKLLPRIYRVGLSEAEIARHLDLFKATRQAKSENFDSLRLVLKAALVSPRFLFREETRTQKGDFSKPYPLDDFALANRLSYFLWSSMPDDALWQRAVSERLRSNLKRKFVVCSPIPRPMLSSAILPANGCSFATWKGPIPTGSLSIFTNELRQALRKETELFFSHLLRENRPVSEFLTANYTFSNNKLADYYKLEGKFDESFKKVSLSGEKRLQRGGIYPMLRSLPLLQTQLTRRSSEADGFWIICWGLRPKSLLLEYLNWRRRHREKTCIDSS